MKKITKSNVRNSLNTLKSNLHFVVCAVLFWFENQNDFQKAFDLEEQDKERTINNVLSIVCALSENVSVGSIKPHAYMYHVVGDSLGRKYESLTDLSLTRYNKIKKYIGSMNTNAQKESYEKCFLSVSSGDFETFLNNVKENQKPNKETQETETQEAETQEAEQETQKQVKDVEQLCHIVRSLNNEDLTIFIAQLMPFMASEHFEECAEKAKDLLAEKQAIFDEKEAKRKEEISRRNKDAQQQQNEIDRINSFCDIYGDFTDTINKRINTFEGKYGISLRKGNFGDYSPNCFSFSWNKKGLRIVAKKKKIEICDKLAEQFVNEEITEKEYVLKLQTI